ncbi:HNH endonuclease signature motif containing protein [Microbacterium sp. MPKO10]|uniref:HNH endonuclease signature motif containing protein n=1 Tax=Microbacterium sp. MPKO10 TaxID=2989818 RepID=UPI002235722C|nr:HNH endonuclease signature motif containing protein [Microbacterium sp. MPKO10]MCW4459161.1 HNH endonuclease [Microbacterium sp. MPKO10]
MDSRDWCSLTSSPLPMGDSGDGLGSEYWMIRDAVEAEDESASPAPEFGDALAAGIDLLGETYDRAQRAQAFFVENLYRAHDTYVRLRDAVLAHSPSGSSSARITDDQAMERSFAAEVATKIGVTDRVAATMIHEAITLVDDLPQLMDALRVGFTSYQHARTAARQAWSVPAEARAEFDSALVGAARTQTPTRFTQTARKLREKLHPESIQIRKDEAFADRRVEHDPAEDGMAYLSLYHSADVTTSIMEQSATRARALRAAGDPRTLSQIQADLVADAGITGIRATSATGSPTCPSDDTRTPLGDVTASTPTDDVTGESDDVTGETGDVAAGGMTADEDSTKGTADDDVVTGARTATEVEAATPGSVDRSDDIRTTKTAGSADTKDHTGTTDDTGTVTLSRAQLAALRPGVVVTVPALSLIGRSSEPAELAGYGPIDPETANMLVGQATSFTRVLTDPVSGAYRYTDPNKYRLSEKMKRAIRLRDVTCDFLECDAPVTYCDIDHIVAWEDGGKSTTQNLHLLCKRHHTLKHATKWTPTRLPDGRVRWTSPAGFSYIVTRE